MDKDKVLELKKKARESGLIIQRIPKNTKEEFVELANNEFCGDYGMTLKHQQQQCEEYQRFKKLLFEGKGIEIIQKKK